MILVSGEPFDFPRIKLLAQICQRIGWTEIIGTTTNMERPTREYDGTLFVDRIVINSSYVLSSKSRVSLFVIYRILKRFLMKSVKTKQGDMIPKQARQSSASYGLVFSRIVREALCQRVCATSIIPRLIICFGLNALVAGVRMKRLYGCSIIYDDQNGEEIRNSFSNRFRAIAESRLLRFADLVVTKPSRMTRELKGRFGISQVLTIADEAMMDKYKRIIECFCDKENQG
jgi:hypothetical protein